MSGPEQFAGQGGKTGRQALEEHHAGLQSEQKQGEEGDPKDELGEPALPAGPAPHAMLSNEELIRRMESGEIEAPKTQPEGKSGKGDEKNPKKAEKKADIPPEVQAEIDRLRALNDSLASDAALGRYVKSNQDLFDNATARMRGGVEGPSGTLGQREPTIAESLGLPSNFVPDPEEFDTPGTDSYRWFEEKVRRQAADVTGETIRNYQEQVRVEREAEMAKDKFLGAGHSEDDLVELLRWVGNGSNFTLEKLWQYRMLDQGQLQVSSGNDGSPGVQTRGYKPSVAAEPGSGHREMPASLGPAVELLKMAERSRNPFVR